MFKCNPNDPRDRQNWKISPIKNFSLWKTMKVNSLSAKFKTKIVNKNWFPICYYWYKLLYYYNKPPAKNYDRKYAGQNTNYAQRSLEKNN